jgi:hypothetical protein
VLFLSAAMITAGVLYWARYFLPGNFALTPIFLQLFADFDAQAASWALIVLVLAVFVSGAFSGRRLLVWINDHIRLLAAATVVLLCVGSLTVYRNHPLSMDEYAQYLQSQIFAAGKLSGHFPAALMDWLVPRGFQNYFLSVSKSTGAVASSYWPSFALLMTPFTALGIPWACNPVISALTLLAAHRLALQIYADREAAALVVLLTVASPEFFINGISYYSMPAHMLANTLFALLLIEPTRSRALLAGIVGSIALTLHNPFPHLLFALPWILWIAGRQDGTRMTFCLGAGYLPLCLLLGIGWLGFMGHVRQAGLPPTSGGDLGSMWHVLAVFSLPNATIVLARMIGIAKICVWAVPGLLVLAIAGAWKGWSNPALRLLTLSALATLLGFFLVPVDQGHGWGYRYFHTAWIALPLLAAGALTRTQVGRKVRTFEDEGSRAFLVTCAVLMLLIGGTLRVMQVRNFINSDLAQLPAYSGREHRIELINASYNSYGADLVQNDPWLRGDVIRMLSHGPEFDAHMMAQYFPDLHEVFRGPHGAVWSAAPVPVQAPRPYE